MMQSSQLDTASPDQDGSRSQTARNATNILHPTRVYDCHNWTLQVRTRTDLVHKRQETRQIFFIQQESMIVTTGHCKSGPGRISFTNGKKHDKHSSSNKSL